jgi:phage-related protein
MKKMQKLVGKDVYKPLSLTKTPEYIYFYNFIDQNRHMSICLINPYKRQLKMS